MRPDPTDALEAQRKDDAELQLSGYHTEPTDGELEQMFLGLQARGDMTPRYPPMSEPATDEQVDAYWRWYAAWAKAYAQTHPLPSREAIAECKRRDLDFLGGQTATVRRERGDVAAELAESRERHWLQSHGLC